MTKLYSYWRSTAAYRARIALNLKNIEYETVSVDLLAGEEYQPDYAAINPQMLVPALEHDGRVLYQSLAIIEYLDETFPEPALLPKDRAARAEVRAFAQSIACDIHPLNNTRVIKYLGDDLGIDESNRMKWYRHWVRIGFEAIETRLEATSDGRFCFGDSPCLADVLLIPQVYNAHRFDVDMKPFPLIGRINEHCLGLDAFARAAPQNQPGAA